MAHFDPAGIHLSDVPPGEGGRRGALPDFPILPGRWLYEQINIGAANVGPVYRLLAFVLMDAEPEWSQPDIGSEDDPEDGAPFYLYDVAEQRIVDGPMVAYHGPDGVQWLTWLLEVEASRVTQRVDPITAYNVAHFYAYNSDPKAVIREWTLGSGGDGAGAVWTAKDYRYRSGTKTPVTDQDGLQRTPLPEGPIPAELFHVFPFGQGVVKRAGKTIQRLNEIAEGIREDDYAERAGTAIIGDDIPIGSARKIRRAKLSGERVYTVPVSGAMIESTVNMAHAAFLLQDRAEFKRDLAELTHTTMLEEGLNASGTARVLAMQQMLNFVKLVRRDCRRVYAAFGATISFPPVTMQEIGDLLQSHKLFTGLWNTGALGRQEYLEMSRHLVGQDGPPPSDANPFPSPDPHPEVTGDPSALQQPQRNGRVIHAPERPAKPLED